jgi:hypothetical protein
MENESGFEAHDSGERVFELLHERIIGFMKERKELGSPLPSSLRNSLKRALAVFGMALMMASPETLAAQQSSREVEADNPTDQTEVYHETSLLKGGERKEALAFNRDVRIGDKTITLTGSASWSGGVFVPDEIHPGQNIGKEKPIINEESAGVEVPIAEHGPVRFTAINEFEHRPSGTAWFLGSEGAFAFPENGKMHGTEASITVGRYFDITHDKEPDSPHSVALGLKGDLRKIPGLEHVPIDGAAYVEFVLPGSRENGVTIGIKLGDHHKK